jgi:hypothetical protein
VTLRQELLLGERMELVSWDIMLSFNHHFAFYGEAMAL